jgi:hypothetical protein
MADRQARSDAIRGARGTLPRHGQGAQQIEELKSQRASAEEIAEATAEGARGVSGITATAETQVQVSDDQVRRAMKEIVQLNAMTNDPARREAAKRIKEQMIDVASGPGLETT